jgi:hypothetical protein
MSTTRPAPPFHLLHEDPAFTYRVPGQPAIRRRLRVYGPAAGQEYYAVVTELGDGMSVTNAAEEVAAAVDALYPARTDRMTVIEHYPAASGCGPEHFDLVAFAGEGRRSPRWAPLPEAWILENLGAEAFDDRPVEDAEPGNA